MKLSKELINFYRSYVEWLDNGAPDMEPFSRRIGLCHNSPNTDDIDIELYDHFKSQFGTGVYPFGQEEYSRDFDNNTMHLDPNRIAWARKWAKEGCDGE